MDLIYYMLYLVNIFRSHMTDLSLVVIFLVLVKSKNCLDIFNTSKLLSYCLLVNQMQYVLGYCMNHLGRSSAIALFIAFVINSA